jgi:hypothetical protein
MSTPAQAPARYRIRIRGHLDPVWSAWFDSLTVVHVDDGTTELAGPLVDQAALFGLLARLRDLGATLLLVEHLTSDQGAPHELPDGPSCPQEPDVACLDQGVVSRPRALYSRFRLP